MSSVWLSKPVVVDGKDSEWQGVMKPVEDKNFTLGMYNDDSYLYLSMVTGNRLLQMQILSLGLTVWLDPTGGKGRALGIRFPLGFGGEREIRGALAKRRAGIEEPDMEGRWAHIEPTLTAFEVVRNGDEDKQRLLRSQSEDIEVDLSYQDQTLTYELKVPLTQNEAHPIGIAVVDGKPVGLRLETPTIDRESIVDRSREGGTETGGGIGGAGGRGGFGGRGGEGQGGFGARRPENSGRPNFPKGLDYWVRVDLAQKSSSSSSSQ